jgi:RimJ/RimL family protein N-acetyltransferase
MRRTDRLVLRAPRAADAERLLQFRNLPEVSRWLMVTTVDPETYGESLRQSAEDPHDHTVLAELDGTVIGIVFLEVEDGMGQPGKPERTEALLGYIMDPAYAGHGYASEAVAAMVDVAFGELGVRRLTAGCFADNLASVRILEKVGMRREQHGVRDSWHAELGWVDGYTYGLLADEWRAARG